MSKDKIELLKQLRDEKWDVYNALKDKESKLADSFYWEMVGLDTAIRILTEEEYYEKRLSAYE